MALAEIQFLESPDRMSQSAKTQSDQEALVGGESLRDLKQAQDESERSFLFRLIDRGAAIFQRGFGLFGIVICVAISATIPLLQFVALGYFFEVSGRIGRRKSFRQGFVGLQKAEKLASILIGTWLLLWPITLLTTWWEASYLIDPLSESTQRLRNLQIVGTILIVCHIVAAWFCGGKLRYFFWPLIAPFAFGIWLARLIASSKWIRPFLDATVGKIAPRLIADLCRLEPISDWFLPAIVWKSIRKGEFYSRARDGLWDFVVGLRLPYLFWFGLRGFVGTMIWLLIPVSIMIAAAQSVDGAAVITGLIGILSFAFVAMHLPMLQAHFATENRFSAMFELSVSRAAFRTAPVRHLITLLLTFVFALPLYLLKIERILPELLFLPAIVFILFMLPTRLMSGWTYLSYQRKEQNAASLWYRWPIWSLEIPLAIVFAAFVFTMRFVVWSGAIGLFDQHAFLVPAPFVEWPF